METIIVVVDLKNCQHVIHKILWIVDEESGMGIEPESDVVFTLNYN